MLFCCRILRCASFSSNNCDTKFGLASIDKIRALLGYDPKVEMQVGLKGVIESISKPQVARIRAGEAA
jgi:hypothetical protein